MATIEELTNALRKADKAGDAKAARRFATEIRRMRSEQVQSEFDALPWYSKLGQAAEDVLRIGSNTITFNQRDNLAQFLGGGTPEQERAETAEARERAGSAALGTDLALLMALPTAAGNAVTIPGRVAASSSEGAALSGLQALGSGDDVEDAMLEGGAWGAGGQAAGEMLSGIARRLFGAVPERPTVDELRSRKNAQYEAMQEEGVTIAPPAIDNLFGMIDEATKRARPVRHPQTIDMRREVRSALRPKGRGRKRGTSLYDVDVTRQAISKDLGTLSDDAERHFGGDMIGTIDDWINRLDDADVSVQSGNRERGVNSLLEGRKLNSRMRKLKTLEEADIKSQRRAASSGSGANTDNALRQNINSVLSNPGKARGFNPDELAEMDKIVRGTGPRNFARSIGKSAPNGLQGMTGIGLGGAIGHQVAGIPGMLAGAAVPPVAGAVGKRIADRSTARAADDLLTMVATGKHPRDVKSPIEEFMEAEKDRIRRALILAGIAGTQ